MNIRIDKDLARRITAYTKLNGISVDKYVNDLVESALNSVDRLAKQQALRSQRDKAANSVWENFDFPSHLSIEATDGWETSGSDTDYLVYTRNFYYLVDDVDAADKPTTKGVFVVRFEAGDASSPHIVALDGHGNRF